MPCCWAVVHQAPLSLGFLRPEYWRGCHFLLYKIAFWRCFLLDCGFDEGRGIPSRAWEWVPVWHLENCPRRGVQARDFIGKGCQGGGQEGEGNGENFSATWLTVSGFMVIGLVSGLSLASHSELGSFLGAHASLSWDGFQQGGSWEAGRTSGLESPISFWPLQNTGWW